jgi:hypothetical protein
VAERPDRAFQAPQIHRTSGWVGLNPQLFKKVLRVPDMGYTTEPKPPWAINVKNLQAYILSVKNPPDK